MIIIIIIIIKFSRAFLQRRHFPFIFQSIFYPLMIVTQLNGKEKRRNDQNGLDVDANEDDTDGKKSRKKIINWFSSSTSTSTSTSSSLERIKSPLEILLTETTKSKMNFSDDELLIWITHCWRWRAKKKLAAAIWIYRDFFFA